MTGANTDSNWALVSEFVEKSMKQTGVPGVGVGILHHGKSYMGGFGVTSVENPLPVTDDTIFQIQSITKTFTGTAIMQLVEQGKIRLDAPVREYIPEFKVADEETSANTTVRHLLTHMEGWDGDFWPDTGMGDDAFAKCTALLADREQISPLGTVWSYNNVGFVVAGDIMERVTGKSFERIIQESVFDPLGLKHSFMRVPDVMVHRFAVGHSVGPEGAKVIGHWGMTAREAGPHGGILSTVPDMLKYAQFHLGDGQTAEGKRLLSTESMAQLHSPQVTIYGKRGFGISFDVNDSFGPRQLSHDGSGYGQSCAMTIMPEHDFAIVVLTNSWEFAVITGATRLAIKQYLGIDMKDPELIPATDKDYEEYVGKYTNPRGYVETGIVAGRLIVQYVQTVGNPAPPMGQPRVMGLVSKDRVRDIGRPFPGTVEFVRRADGTVGWLRMGRVYKKL